MKRMAMVKEDPSALDAILITHEHQDHVAGLSVLARRLRIPVYFSEPTHRAWVRMMTPSTTMTYAKWLEHVQREKEARAAQDALETAEARLLTDLESSGAKPAMRQARSRLQRYPRRLKKRTRQKPYPGATRPACRVEYFQPGTNFSIGDLMITPFHHSARCGRPLRLRLRVGLGVHPHGHRHRPRLHASNVKRALERIDVLLLESNQIWRC